MPASRTGPAGSAASGSEDLRWRRTSPQVQDATAERRIVALRTPLPDLKPALRARLIADAVAVARATRAHEDIRQGSSVRGAIDLALVARQLFNVDPERLAAPHGPASAAPGPAERDQVLVPAGRGSDTPGQPEAAGHAYRELVYDAMVVALSGRIFLDETVEDTPDDGAAGGVDAADPGARTHQYRVPAAGGAA